ncbi:hypothetical protein QTN25_009115 [Entamoeba marina]
MENTFTNKKPRSKTNVMSQRELKQESKSWEAIQQSVLIYLLVECGYSISIERPDKFAHLSKHFFVVTNVKKSDTTINFSEEISRICQRVLRRNDNICQPKQLKRHDDKNRSSLSINLMIDFAQTHGYEFTKRGTRSSIYTIKMEKFCEILKNGKVVYGKDEIYSLGCKINDLLREMCIDSNGRQFIDISYNDLKSIDEIRIINDDDSLTTDEIVSRSTSRGEINERVGSPLSAFRKVCLGENYIVF